MNSIVMKKPDDIYFRRKSGEIREIAVPGYAGNNSDFRALVPGLMIF